MNDPSNNTARPKEQPSHADITARQDMAALVMQRIEGKLDELVKTVGYVGTDDRGALVGTGIAGDLGRLKERVDQRFRRYDAWERAAAVSIATATLFIIAIWWLVRDRAAEVFRP